jgi:UDP-N-acetylmuramate dehydrogenase
MPKKIIKKVDNRYIEGQNLKFSDLDMEFEGEEVLVTFGSGVDLSIAINHCIKNGLSGLEYFAGIPGTMGGALYNNIHGGTRHISDIFVSCEVLVDEDFDV